MNLEKSIHRNQATAPGLGILDEDQPLYISDNTYDEMSHAAFLNAYLHSKGEEGVDPVPNTAEQQGNRSQANRPAHRSYPAHRGHKLVDTLPQYQES